MRGFGKHGRECFADFDFGVNFLGAFPEFFRANDLFAAMRFGDFLFAFEMAQGVKLFLPKRHRVESGKGAFAFSGGDSDAVAIPHGKIEADAERERIFEAVVPVEFVARAERELRILAADFRFERGFACVVARERGADFREFGEFFRCGRVNGRGNFRRSEIY